MEQFLDIERRTGVKSEDVDDFVRKADDIQSAIAAMMRGEISPDQVKIQGIDTPEEKAEKERILEEKRREARERQELLEKQRREEERTKWWAGAELYRPKSSNEIESNSTNTKSIEEMKEMKRQLHLERYTSDYNRWNSWIPNDEATLEEIKQKELIEEEQKNKEFELNNPEFCKQFLSDTKKRQESELKKQKESEKLRLNGNNLYKKHNYQLSLLSYEDGLRLTPFDIRLLMNKTQCLIKLQNWNDSYEFLSRVLYLDEKNIKALSRLAYVQYMTNCLEDSLKTLDKALKIDPKNVDLLSQLHEYTEKWNEKEIMNKLEEKKNQKISTDSASAADASAADASSSSVDNEKVEWNIFHLTEFLLNDLNEINHLFLDNEKEFSSIEDKIVDLVTSMTSYYELSTKLSIEDQNLLRTQIRSLGVLKILIHSLKNSWIKYTSGNRQSRILRSFQLIGLRIFGFSIRGQYGGKQIALDEKIYPHFKILLGESFIDHADILIEALRNISILCEDEVNSKSRTLVLLDHSLPAVVASAIGDPVFCLRESWNTSSPKEVQMSSVEVNAAHTVVGDCLTLLRQLLFTGDTGKQTLANADRNTTLAFLGALTAVIECYLESATDATKNIDRDGLRRAVDTLESCIDCLVIASQVEDLRALFAIRYPVGRGSSEKPDLRSLADAVLRVARDHTFLASNSLAALLNASIDGESPVRQALFDSGALLDGLIGVRMSKTARESAYIDKDFDGTLLVRRAGLLTRLTSIPQATESLKQPTSYQLLCRILRPLPPTVPQWARDEQLHIIRVLAALSTDLSSEVLAAGNKEEIMSSMLAYLPHPCTEGDTITPRSVTLVPKNPASAILIGNVARALMPYADDSSSATRLFTERKWVAIEKFISAMATCSDIRVRRNLAILLAKGCRIPGVRERVTEFRGMQMIVELQKNL